jgi:nucleotide-binding universal stress UspA family protein
MYRKILVAFDGSPESRVAVSECEHFTHVADREVHLACVVHDPSVFLLAGEFVPQPMLEVDRDEVRADLDAAAAGLAARGFKVTTHLLDGDPVEVIAGLSRTLGIDLLVVGHKRSKTWALRWWRSPVDSLLVERVNCAILIAAGK